MKRVHILFLILIVLAGCKPASYTQVTIQELLDKPNDFVGKDLEVKGQIVEEIGEKSYFVAYPYFVPKTTCKGSKCTSTLEMKLNLSQVKVVSWKFQETDGVDWIEVSQKKGGLYVPLPIMLTSKPSLPSDLLALKGKWVEKQDGGYLLQVIETEAATPTP